MSPFNSKYRACTARKQSESPIRLKTDARPSRDGYERFGSGTQAYGQI